MKNDNINILLIEDDPGDALIIKGLLAKNRNVSIDLKQFHYLSSGLAFLKNNDVDVVLLDLGLPDSKGLDTFIKMYEFIPSLPIIVLTGHDDEDAAMKAMRCGAQDYLVKGQIDKFLLIRAIQYAIGRKHVQEKIHRKEESYHTLFNLSPEAIMMIDFNGTILDCNDATSDLVKKPKEDIINKKIKNFEFLNGVSSRDTKERHIMITRGDYCKSGLVEYEIYYHSKTSRWLEIFPAILNNDNKKIAMQVVIRDITDRKLAEEALQKSQASLAEAQRIAHLGNWDWDIKNNTLWWSNEIYRIFGLNLQQFDANYEAFLNTVHIEDREFVERSVNQALNENKPFNIDLRIILPDGTLKTVQEQAEVFYDHRGKPIRMVGTVLDITERKLAEDKLKTSLEEKEILLKEVHHRVKNNMQVISSLLNLQIRKIKDEKTAEIFKDSQNRIKSMAIIHEHLYRSRDLSSVNFSEYLKSLIRQLSHTNGRNNKPIKMNLNVNNVFLDINTAIPCGLIINELVSNSFKHAFPDEYDGEITVGLNSDRDNNYVLIVNDNGVGFPENLNFKKTESLGLQLVNTLVDQIDGSIELENYNGTKFKIVFEKQKYHNGEPLNE